MPGLLQNLLSPAKRFDGELTTYRSGRLELHSTHSYGVNQSMKLAVGSETFRVHLLASRVLPDGRTIVYEGAFREDPAEQDPRLLEALRRLGGRGGADLRHKPRLGRVFRVRSQALANFRATTRDVSETGVCVACEGPVPPGTEMELTLDLDTVNAPSLRCRAEVVWCRPEGGARMWLVGFRFTDLSAHGLVVLQGFLEQVRALAEDPHGQGPP